MQKNPTAFRYNTGTSAVPWAAVGESYTARDSMDVIGFLLQGEGSAYEHAFGSVECALQKLASVGVPPGKLSLGDQVAKLEREVDRYLGIEENKFITNATAGFEDAFLYTFTHLPIYGLSHAQLDFMTDAILQSVEEM
jgi:hypothetical protein